MKRFIMIGAPITTVRTPPLLEANLAQRGIDAIVDVVHVEPDELEDFICTTKFDNEVDGLLVTMPHKKTIIPCLDSITNVAGLANSVNAVKRLESGGLVGAQFDGIALLHALHAAGAQVRKSRVLLAGLGGAGLAIALAIVADDCQHLVITDNNPALMDSALKELGEINKCSISALRRSDSRPYDILINATPLGMCADDASVFDESRVAKAIYVADIVADPLQTQLAAIVQRTDATLISGRMMVESQIQLISDWLLDPELQQ